MTAFGYIVDAGQGVKQGGLARTAGADNGHHQLTIKPLGNIVYHPDCMVALLFQHSSG